MRILLSVENFYPRLGGGEVIMDELMTELEKAGHEVYVLYVGRYKKGSRLNLIPQDISKTFKNIPLFNRTNIRLYFANHVWKRLLDKKVAELKPDIIITQLEYTPASVDVAKKHKIPVVVYLNNFDHFCPMLFKHKRPEECKRNCFFCETAPYKLQHLFSMRYLHWHERALRNADLILSDSRYVSKILSKFYNLKSYVLPCVLYIDRFRVKRQGRYLTFINPIKTKGAEIVLELAMKMPSENFLVVGGKDQDFISKFKQLKNVRYVPWCEDMQEIYRVTKVLLVPSLWTEPYGRVIPEAQISGIPCITSARGGIPEAVGKGGIIIDDPYDIERWIIAIEALKDRKRYGTYSKLAKKNAENLTFSHQWPLFVKYINTLFKEHHSPPKAYIKRI